MKHAKLESAAEEAKEQLDPNGDKDSYEPHEVEMASEHLMKAEEVKGKPNLHSAAKEHLAKKHAAIGKAIHHGPKDLSDLKKMAKAKVKEMD